MSNKQKARTFEIKMVFTVSDEKKIHEMLEMKQEILSGQLQREMVKDGVEKVIMTFTEIKGGNK
jgi:hypothetical protein